MLWSLKSERPQNRNLAKALPTSLNGNYAHALVLATNGSAAKDILGARVDIRMKGAPPSVLIPPTVWINTRNC